MKMRKIAVGGAFAAGAALAFAPLASADPAAVDPTVVTDTLGSEESVLNSLFVTYADIAGVPSTDYTDSGGFDTIDKADVSTVTPATAPFSPLDYELFGVSPGTAGVTSDPGSYDDFNGALTEFDNAYNVELYSLLNGGTLDTSVADYIQNNALDHALTLGSTTDAFDYLYNFAIGDLSGFFDTNLSFLDIG
jgi:hypothetical protein